MKSIGMVFYFLFAQIIVTVGIVLLKLFTDDAWCTQLSDCLLNERILSNQYFSLIFELLTPTLIAADVIIALPILINAYRKREKVYSAINPSWFVFFVAFGLVVNFVVSSIVDVIPSGSAASQYDALIGLAFSGNFIFVALSTGIFAPLIEELIFRYCICNFYKDKRMAIFVSAFLFGLAHMNLVQSSYAFVIGLLLAWLFVTTNNLTIPTVIHVTINLSSVIFEYVENYWIFFVVSIMAFVFVMYTLNCVIKQRTSLETVFCN